MNKNIIYHKLKKNRLILLLTLSLIFIETFLISFSTISLAPILDYFSDDKLYEKSKVTKFFFRIGLPNNISHIIIIFYFIFLFSYLLRIVVQYFSLKFKYLFLYDVINTIYTSIVEANWNYLKRKKPGEMINAVRMEIEKFGNIFMSTASLLSDFIQFLFLFGFAILLNYKISTLIVILTIILITPLLLFKKYSFKYGELLLITNNNLFENLNNLIRNIKIVITNNLGKSFVSNYSNLFQSHAKSSIKSSIINNAVPQLVYPLGILSFILSISFIKNHENSLTDIALIFVIFYRIIPLLSSILSNYNIINNLLPSVNNLQTIYSDCSKNISKNYGLEFNNLRDNITVSKLYYKHPDQDYFFFKNLSFSINKFTIFGIIGASGSGKTTLVDLLTGNLNYSKGKISYDSESLSDFNLNQFRNKISIIGQDAPIFHDTLLNNLLIQSQDINDKYVDYVLEITGVKSISEKLPQNYNTILGEGGVILSGGQKQKVALARALIKKPIILILDEYASSLDKVSENKFNDIILSIKNQTTIIMITHNLENINLFDNFIELKDGQLINKK